jgi:hypothetical protein
MVYHPQRHSAANGENNPGNANVPMSGQGVTPSRKGTLLVKNSGKLSTCKKQELDEAQMRSIVYEKLNYCEKGWEYYQSY